MEKRILNIVESGHRATLEEQDDTILWLTHAMRGAEAEVAVLLCGNAVGYGVRAQDASGLAFGSRRQTRPPALADDVERLLGKRVDVMYLADDAAERGLVELDLVAGLTPVERAKLPELFARYDHILHW